jgi:hypothetical protein
VHQPSSFTSQAYRRGKVKYPGDRQGGIFSQTVTGQIGSRRQGFPGYLPGSFQAGIAGDYQGRLGIDCLGFPCPPIEIPDREIPRLLWSYLKISFIDWLFLTGGFLAFFDIYNLATVIGPAGRAGMMR